MHAVDICINTFQRFLRGFLGYCCHQQFQKVWRVLTSGGLEELSEFRKSELQLINQLCNEEGHTADLSRSYLDSVQNLVLEQAHSEDY